MEVWTLALCILATANMTQGAATERMPVCVELVERAEAAGEDPVLVVSMAVEESSLNPDKVNPRTGAFGLLQAIPKWHCPNGKRKGCDPVEAGFTGMRKWRKRFPGMAGYHKDPAFLCHYNSGNECYASSRQYARNIMKRVHAWRPRLDVSRELWREEQAPTAGGKLRIILDSEPKLPLPLLGAPRRRPTEAETSFIITREDALRALERRRTRP